jgi:hypothetical protein
VSVGTEPARLSDLFASAVHRYGAVWPDLLVVSLIGTVLAGLPAVLLHQHGRPASTVYVAAALAYGVAYFAFLGFVVLRGLPQPAPARRVVATYLCGAATGIVTGVLLLFLEPFVVIVIPLFMMAVPAVAAGDESVWGAPWRSFAFALGNFQRTWAVWLVTMVFSAPVIISMFLIVSAFSSGIVAQLLALGCSVPIVWPFSALFIRALYGDLTGRRVLAAEDRG